MSPDEAQRVYEQICDLWALCTPVPQIAKAVRLPQRLVAKVIQRGTPVVLTGDDRQTTFAFDETVSTGKEQNS